MATEMTSGARAILLPLWLDTLPTYASVADREATHGLAQRRAIETGRRQYVIEVEHPSRLGMWWTWHVSESCDPTGYADERMGDRARVVATH